MTTMTAAELAARRALIDEQLDRLSQEKQQINARLLEAYKGEAGNHDAGDYTVQIKANRRLDTARLAQRFPVAQYPHLYNPTISTAAVRENFSPVELEAYQVEGAQTVIVK